MPVSTIPFSQTTQWSFKQRSTSLSLQQEISSSNAALDAAKDDILVKSWKPVASVPSNVHLDLKALDLIPEPFENTNENDLQWIGERDWWYKCEFTVDQATLDLVKSANVKADLVFDGLDTFATVFLNGAEVYKSDNMFIAHRVAAVNSKLVLGTNTLHILFESAFLKGIAAQKADPQIRECWNGDASRTYIRKAQYHWGWDWGPVFMTCGPWLPAKLEIITAGRIEDVWAVSELNDKFTEATVKVQVETVDAAAGSDIKLDLYAPGTSASSGAKPLQTTTVKVANNAAAHTFKVSTPALWWPVGSGAQPLYTLTATLLASSAAHHSVSHRIGLRRIRIVENPIAPTITNADPTPKQKEAAQSTTFYFEVNGKPIFAAGANWIPADNFLPRVSEASYTKWMQLAVNANFNMVRVWGGGIYETNKFYDLCDEMGLLVWQDFMFACGTYPAHPDFVANVDKEARYNLKRLRNHPSICIWTGNNEDYAYAEGAPHLNFDPKSNDEKQWAASGFPARLIYEKVLPKACTDLWPQITYRPGSPYGGTTSADPLVADVHQWNVWHGTQEPYQNYGLLAGRFVSEFGMQGFPDYKTLMKMHAPSYPVSKMHESSIVVDHHNKATGFLRRIACYVHENLRFKTGLENYAYATQLMQAEALGHAYRLWRRQFQGVGKEKVSGALVWQLNDCWPCVSWAIVDYHHRPKPSYFAIKRETAPVTLGSERNPVNAKSTDTSFTTQIWGSNFTTSPVNATLTVKAFNLTTPSTFGTLLATTTHKVTLPPNQSTELPYYTHPLPTPLVEGASNILVFSTLTDSSTGKILAKSYDWPQPLRYMPYPTLNPHLTTTYTQTTPTTFTVTLQTAKPVKGVLLSVEPQGFKGYNVAGEADAIAAVADKVEFEDNLVDVVPGEVVEIKGKGALLEGWVVKARYYGEEEH
ncbi:hypothetical protein HDV05_001030 [Chytridiales sp. JEL 0842]|nr:hypothetical protein HDV05_001030 [Chytridiales sp. JEL 0842]